MKVFHYQQRLLPLLVVAMTLKLNIRCLVSAALNLQAGNNLYSKYYVVFLKLYFTVTTLRYIE